MWLLNVIGTAMSAGVVVAREQAMWDCTAGWGAALSGGPGSPQLWYLCRHRAYSSFCGVCVGGTTLVQVRCSRHAQGDEVPVGLQGPRGGEAAVTAQVRTVLSECRVVTHRASGCCPARNGLPGCFRRLRLGANEPWLQHLLDFLCVWIPRLVVLGQCCSLHRGAGTTTARETEHFALLSAPPLSLRPHEADDI